MSKKRLLIYGANGYTGELIADRAAGLGVDLVLGGRREEAIEGVAKRLGVEFRIASVGVEDRLDRLVDGISVVLNAAGPFSMTALPIAEACIRAGIHYLDITGEIAVIESLQRRHARARRVGSMIMPGVGFDVVPSDCLALHVARRLPSATHLALAMAPLAFASSGSMKTFLEHAGDPVWIRRNGELVGITPGMLRRSFRFDDGARSCAAVSWGDVASAYYTTGIPNIEVYFECTPQLEAVLTSSRYFGRLMETAPSKAWFAAHFDLMQRGPSDDERASAGTSIVAEAWDDDGRRFRSQLQAPEAYTLTSESAPTIAQRVLAGDFEPGFQTPARVYGTEFVLSLAGVTRRDLDDQPRCGSRKRRASG